MKNLRRLAVVSVLAIVSVASLGAVADGGTPKKVAVFNLTETPLVKPSRIFLSANAGPYIKSIRWSNWGEAKTVGRGRFISDCASCGPKENKPAVITLWKLETCKSPKVRSYRYGKLRVVDPTRKRVAPLPLGCID